MKRLEKENALEFEVEDLAHLIISKQYDLNSLKSHISRLDLSSEEKNRLLMRTDWAYDRIHRPLDITETIFLILIPFGHLNTWRLKYLFKIRPLEDSDILNVKEQRRLGFKRKVDEFYIYSIIGVLTYLAIILIIYFT